MNYSKIEFKKEDKNNKIISAIYPLQEIINEEIKYKESLGGSNTEQRNENTRFEGLGVPIGLYLFKPKNLLEESINKKHGGNSKNKEDIEVIDNNLFEKLFKNIEIKKK